MKMTVRVKPGVRKERIEKEGANQFVVFVTARPEKGSANEVVIKLIADYFGISRSRVTIVRGITSRAKILEIR